MADSSSAPPPARIFISYKHKVEPDQTVVNQIVAAIRYLHNSRANTMKQGD
jgi:hypothetical protein